jgi:5-methyltetrahydrofolate--homocysteine methyltransferase
LTEIEAMKPIQNRAEQLERLLRERIVVLDGAMGTMVQYHKLDEAAYRGERFKNSRRDLQGLHDLLCLTQPQIIEGIHKQYLEAGADLIETNTFNAQSLSLADYGMEGLAYEINLAAAQCARRAADAVMAASPGRVCFVAGALGPTNKTASISTDANNPAARSTTFDETSAAYYEQAKGLLDGGVDLLLVETIFDTLVAKAAFFAILKLFEERGIRPLPYGHPSDLAGKVVPILASVTFIQASPKGSFTGQFDHAWRNFPGSRRSTSARIPMPACPTRFCRPVSPKPRRRSLRN